MGKVDLATMRANKHFAKQDYDRELIQAKGGSDGSAFGDAGPPNWNRSSWEAFRATYGFYPYGMQNGAMVHPPTFAGAPDWVYELMQLRKPPVQVSPESW